jgi:hypothetical protein
MVLPTPSGPLTPILYQQASRLPRIVPQCVEAAAPSPVAAYRLRRRGSRCSLGRQEPRTGCPLGEPRTGRWTSRPVLGSAVLSSAPLDGPRESLFAFRRAGWVGWLPAPHTTPRRRTTNDKRRTTSGFAVGHRWSFVPGLWSLVLGRWSDETTNQIWQSEPSPPRAM